MPHQKSPRQPARPAKNYRGYRATAGRQTLKSWTVGGLPIINHLLDRIGLQSLLEQHLPPDDPRLEVPTSRCLLLLVRNLLISREPIYGLGEWAERYPPDLRGISAREIKHLNDDRIGRCLDRLFDAKLPELLLDVVRHVVQEFDLSLEELHNDSTTVSFYGAYEGAAEAGRRRGQSTLAITYGHSKARRPDLKQLLYILTVTEDGGVPVYFTSDSGNVADDTTHRATWDLLCKLTGRPDFLYVADCKLATTDNLQYLDRHGGRFVTVLPRTRREDVAFRRRLLEKPPTVSWEAVYDVAGDDGELRDRLQACREEHTSTEGFRVLWYHSSRKAQRDAASRARSVERTLEKLAALQARLLSPKTRFRQRGKVEQAVEDILSNCGAARWVRVQVEQIEQAAYKQATRGRPNSRTKYVKQVSTRFRLSFAADSASIAKDLAGDGVFPLITNDRQLTAEQLLRAYKRQPLIEKRFSQFKTDFEVAPVYLKEVSRIQALMAVYFLALLVQTLLERELRQAMSARELDSLPLYPEGRACRAPTTRRVLDVLEPVQRHELNGGDEATVFVTELSSLQRTIIKLLGLKPNEFGY